MASIIQCLSNTPPLTKLFISGAYVADINRDNVLGNGGALAESFASLLKLFWPEARARAV